MPHTLQISQRDVTIHRFLRKIGSAHQAVARRGVTRQVLHYNTSTKGLEPWLWPVYNGEGNPALATSRVELSGLEEYWRYHEFQAPLCLCAHIDGTPYTKSRIKLVESGERGGHTLLNVLKNDAAILVSLRIRANTEGRGNLEIPLEMDQSSMKEEEDQGLLVMITAKLAQSEGIDEKMFRATIKQCNGCKRLVLKRSYVKYRCPGRRQAVVQLSGRWGEGNVIDLTRED
ncbi:hypothetical protein BKA70DRAFT_1238182 [Coprinopsis sp. MPI-PUGE-AT-0042]|nr:hypothetical protein BKA70DRAFT_1238182 [Coprinopsis sp. MPI-PUGE-AT-0042]